MILRRFCADLAIAFAISNRFRGIVGASRLIIAAGTVRTSGTGDVFQFNRTWCRSVVRAIIARVVTGLTTLSLAATATIASVGLCRPIRIAIVFLGTAAASARR